MIALYITLWLLSGFLAAWVMQRYLDECKYDYAVGPVLVMSVMGPLVLFVVTCMLGGKMLTSSFSYLGKLSKKPLFKAKEPK